MITIGTFYAILGAAIALGGAGLSTAIGVASAGITGAESVAEKKENFKNALILQALPQTQTIYAFIIGILIIMGTGLLVGNPKDLTAYQGLAYLGSGLVVALTGLTAILQGKVASAGIISSAKDQSAFAPNLVFTGQCETPAIFGFIISLMLLIVGMGVLG